MAKNGITWYVENSADSSEADNEAIAVIEDALAEYEKVRQPNEFTD
jgi:hypothetical protein